MQNTIMDRFSEKQAYIGRRLAEAASCYSELWSKLIAEWNSPGTDDKVWLTYSANYLFRTHNIRWAIDPLTLSHRIQNAPEVDVACDLSCLSFVLLTHGHHDHLNTALLSALRNLPILWLVPEFLLPVVIEEAGLPHENIIVPRPLEPIELDGIRILPFPGLHWECTADGKGRGVPAVGYLFEFNGKRWLFPGDTRTYDLSQLPAFGPVDGLFAHLWLGRGSALCKEPPLLESFCHFFRGMKPRRIILTHLHEFGRDANDFWDAAHVQKISAKFQELAAAVQISSAFMGESVLL